MNYNKLTTAVFWACFLVIVVGLIITLSAVRPLICRVVTWDYPEGRVRPCFKTGSDVRGGQPEPEASATYEYPTATPTEWQPYSTATRTATPLWITDTPYPEPEQTGEPYP
jgi:hypothetical protein